MPDFTGADDELLPIAYSINENNEQHLHWEQTTITRAGVLEWVDLTMGPLPSDKHKAGGFVFGQLQTFQTKSCGCSGTKRRRLHKGRGAVAYRSAITLDADEPWLVDDFLGRLRRAGWAGLVYTSARATKENPKYRVILWVDRGLDEDEYWLATKRAMMQIGIEAFDKGTPQAERTMYRPASVNPEAFYSEVLEGKPVCVDQELEAADLLGIEPRGARRESTAVDAGSWLTGLAGSAAEPCEVLQRALAKYQDRFEAEDDKNPVALDAVNFIIRSAEEGHHGVVAALSQLQENFQNAITGGRDIGGPGGEFDRMIQGASAIAAAAGTPEEDRACCLSAADAFKPEADPFAVLTGKVTRGLGRRAESAIPRWKTETVDANTLAKAILRQRWTETGESGDEGCYVLRMWASVAYEHHGPHWEAIPPDHLEAELKRVLEAGVTPKRNPKTGKYVLQDGKKVWVPVKINPAMLATIARLIELETIVHARLGSGHWIDCTSGRCVVGEADRRYVSFQNGILDLVDDVLFAHESAFFNTYSLRFPHDPGALAPFWVKTLEAWFPGDRVSQDTLEEILGYLILGGMERDKIFVFLGERRAGKGTVMRIVKNMLGTGFSAQALDEMGDRFGKEDLIGKRVVHITEAVGGQGAKRVVSTMKAISGRDDGQTIKIKGGKSVQVDFECRFVLTGNEDLDLPDSSGVIADRLVALRFGVSFQGREDYELDAKLAAEYSGIFNRIRVAYDRLVVRGKFVQPEAGALIIDRIRRTAAPGKVWFGETFDITGDFGDLVTLEDAVADYEENCGDADTKTIRQRQSAVSAMFTDAGLEVLRERLAVGDEKTATLRRFVRGVRFKPEDED